MYRRFSVIGFLLKVYKFSLKFIDFPEYKISYKYKSPF